MVIAPMAPGLASADHLDDDVTPPYVFIQDIQYAGSGCPAGSVWSNLWSDHKRFQLVFDSFAAEVGPYVSRAESRKNCQIMIDLDYPHGWSFAIDEGRVSGFAALEPGVTGMQTTKYYFQG